MIANALGATSAFATCMTLVVAVAAIWVATRRVARLDVGEVLRSAE